MTTNFITVTQKRSFEKILIALRNEIVVIFVSTTNSGRLAFLGLNKEKPRKKNNREYSS